MSIMSSVSACVGKVIVQCHKWSQCHIVCTYNECENCMSIHTHNWNTSGCVVHTYEMKLHLVMHEASKHPLRSWQEIERMYMVRNVVEETSHNKLWQGIGERKEMGVLWTYSTSPLTSTERLPPLSLQAHMQLPIIVVKCLHIMYRLL